MHFDRSDIIQAYYLYFVKYYSGQVLPKKNYQNSREYRRLCKIKKYFKPSDNLKAHGVHALSKNAWEIYKTLIQKEWES